MVSDRLKILAILQKTALTMRHFARERPNLFSPEMLRISDELAHEVAKLEGELIELGLLAPAARAS